MGSSHTLPRCQLPPQEEEMDLEPGYYFTIPAERQEEDPPTLRLVSKQVSVPTEPAELPAFSPTHGFEEARYSEEDRSCRRALVPFVQSSWVSLARRRSSTYWRRTHPVVFVRKSGRSADCANNGIQSKLLMVFGDNEKHSYFPFSEGTVRKILLEKRKLNFSCIWATTALMMMLCFNHTKEGQGAGLEAMRVQRGFWEKVEEGTSLEKVHH
ncbi:uncharacterized protein LOC122228361 isoform X2 [Panthera leo]|uniref:uncharacterized protein LOC122228361 isoform X2 n=1 Tax=Panthera leo TaxID=9689 RepID=UPI001C6A1184|nr:uncharacterized protein LOC122228361 isoform X2 [Panthera leo]